MSAGEDSDWGWRSQGVWPRRYARLVAVLVGIHTILNLGLAIFWAGQAWFFAPASFAAAVTAALVWVQHPWAARAHAGLWLATLSQTFMTVPAERAPLVATVILPTALLLLVLAVRPVPRRYKRYVVQTLF